MLPGPFRIVFVSRYPAETTITGSPEIADKEYLKPPL
jgi:hypothetical protein